MNAAFEHFLALPEPERKGVFQSAAARLDTLPGYMEKDFWVCFVLEGLYNRLPEGHPVFFFKGGTSLSKAFGLISRFSEDIDVVIDREGLGFGKDNDPTLDQSGLSKKARKASLENLRAVCGGYMQDRLAPALESALGGDCAIINDAADSETLLVEYPTLYPEQSAGYVRPQVKLEGGARSALEPYKTAAVKPYIADELQDESSLAVNGLCVIAPERTYLEKLLILHGVYCGYRDDKSRIPKDENRISRHYYDVAVMTETEAGGRALANKDLLKSVREHSARTFPQAWRKIEEAAPGTVKLAPQPELREVIMKDYKAMQGMILGDVPDFEWLMAQIQTAEEKINRQGA